VKKNKGDVPIGVVILICMETTQGNTLFCYLYLKLAKTPCFPFYLLQYWRTGIPTGSARAVGGQGSWWGEMGVGGGIL
jgi:hypothetical protein